VALGFVVGLLLLADITESAPTNKIESQHAVDNVMPENTAKAPTTVFATESISKNQPLSANATFTKQLQSLDRLVAKMNVVVYNNTPHNSTAQATGASTQTTIAKSFDARGLAFVPMGVFFNGFGYRFYRPAKFVGGFLFASVLLYLALLTAAGDMTATLVGTLFGVVFGIISLYVYPLGVFILGANWGVVLVLMLFGAVILPGAVLGSMLVIVGLVCGILVLYNHPHKETDDAFTFPKILICCKTAYIGAYLFFRGIGMLAGDFPPELDTYEMAHLPESYFAYICGSFGLGLVGTFLQLRFTHWENCGRSQEDGASAGEEKPLTSEETKDEQ
jgi:hypothetical protein